jgi:hypothetical protein
MAKEQEATPVRPATAAELNDHEIEAGRRFSADADAFLAFPTTYNLEGLMRCGREYQDAWMNGRVRPFIAAKKG